MKYKVELNTVLRASRYFAANKKVSFLRASERPATATQVALVSHLRYKFFTYILSLSGAFVEIKKIEYVFRHVHLSVCTSELKNSVPTERIFTKFGISVLFEILRR